MIRSLSVYFSLALQFLPAMGAAQATTDAPNGASVDRAQTDLNPIKKAQQALSKSDGAAALEALQASAPSLQVRYLRAMATAQLGSLESAAEQFESLAWSYGALQHRCTHQAGLLFEQLGRFDKAIASFSSVPETAWIFPEARESLARVYKARGEPQAAYEALKPLLGWELTKQQRYSVLRSMSSLAKETGDQAAAKKASRELTAVGTWWAAQMGLRFGTPAVTLVAGAEDMIDPGTCRTAGRLALKLAAEKDPTSCSMKVIAAEAATCAGKDVTGELKKIIKACDEGELGARAHLTLGSLWAKQGKAAEALSSLRAAAGKTDSPMWAAEARFASFWLEWKREPTKAPVVDLDAIEAMPSGTVQSQDRARAQYWRARVALAKGDSAGAAQSFAEVAMQYPVSWYAYLARRRLAELDDQLATKVALANIVPTQDAARLPGVPQLDPGLEALELGLENAADEIVWLAHEISSPDANGIAVEALRAKGEDYRAHRFARSVLRNQLGGASQTRAVWKAAFPELFVDTINRYADDEGVPRNLLRALVREESAFNPQARSHVGALGLTQLMPFTARAVARQRKAPLGQLSELFDANKNVELGAAYLGQMLKRFDGEAAFAAAAYNGGPTRVSRWLKVRPCDQLEEWVEEIPITETRDYVKNVLASSDVYGAWPLRPKDLDMATTTGGSR